ncbi:hypothetical protein F8G81_14985 [Arthrobacter sp. CDRTa11]|uniref:hypothetical protein n=1 Tax=Arthrobacter sp. CDRTa11 TaxID=2651199 RepID=UPI0022659FFF|nr:hypothetical protein [Arthrobacter sp. CDRTa11]UZX03765.1 hypothetical protein F8G81_14985 [Arthrobacter sp. CDRTa11]
MKKLLVLLAATALALVGCPAPTNSGSPVLDLPRVPWEGASAFYEKFPVTKAAGWADRSFFPIGSWWNNFSSDENVKFDKAHGLNTYFEVNPDSDPDLLAANGMTYIGHLKSAKATAESTRSADMLPDEIDGRYDPPSVGIAELQRIIDEYGDTGRMKYNNFTAVVASKYNNDQITAGNTYVNMVDGPVSVDGYWYTDTHCSDRPYVDWSFVPVNESHCRTASSYGKMVKSVRERVASDGILQPVYVFVELMGGGTESTASNEYISPAEIQGAVMNGIINEARGVVYFNQSFNGACTGGNLIRQVQVDPNHCMADNIAGMREINLKIKSLAPILNTQSYVHTFGPNLDTMLKTHEGAAYIFAMPSGEETSAPGERTFTLPKGITGTSVEVVGEGRTLPVMDGRFSDSFAAEYTHHVYRVTL